MSLYSNKHQENLPSLKLRRNSLWWVMKIFCAYRIALNASRLLRRHCPLLFPQSEQICWALVCIGYEVQSAVSRDTRPYRCHTACPRSRVNHHYCRYVTFTCYHITAHKQHPHNGACVLYTNQTTWRNRRLHCALVGGVFFLHASVM